MKYDLLDNLQLDNEGMAKAIAREIDSIIAQGGTDSSRLAQEAAQNPTDASTWFDLGVALIADADMLDYLMAQKYLMDNPGTEIDENTVYADASLKESIYEKSLKCFAKVLELEPDYYGVYYQRGTVFANLRNYAEAEKSFLLALEDDPEDFSAAHDLAMVYQDMGDEERCNKYLDMAERLAAEE